jgi:hypothetical protein
MLKTNYVSKTKEETMVFLVTTIGFCKCNAMIYVLLKTNYQLVFETNPNAKLMLLNP